MIGAVTLLQAFLWAFLICLVVRGIFSFVEPYPRNQIHLLVYRVRNRCWRRCVASSHRWVASTSRSWSCSLASSSWSNCWAGWSARPGHGGQAPFRTPSRR